MEERFLKKVDLETYRKQIIAHLSQIELDYVNFTQLLKYTDERIENFKDEVDKVIDEVTDGSTN